MAGHRSLESQLLVNLLSRLKPLGSYIKPTNIESGCFSQAPHLFSDNRDLTCNLRLLIPTLCRPKVIVLFDVGWGRRFTFVVVFLSTCPSGTINLNELLTKFGGISLHHFLIMRYFVRYSHIKNSLWVGSWCCNTATLTGNIQTSSAGGKPTHLGYLPVHGKLLST